MEDRIDKEIAEELELHSKLHVGQKLFNDVCNENGILLLRAEKAIERESWINRLKHYNGVTLKHTPTSASPMPLRNNTHSPVKPVVSSRHSVNKENTLDVAAFAESVLRATEIKKETVSNVTKVFSRLGSEKRVEAVEVKTVVSNLIESLMEDQNALLSLTSIKDADNYTYMHSVNVGVLTICLAIRLGYQSELEQIGVGGLMHDVGKTQIPLEVLHKPGPLNQGEAHIMRQHPVIGAKILMDSGGFDPISVLCTRDHHESRNGIGYPGGRKEGQLSDYSQIVSIADVYDALTTDRPCRAAMTPKHALTLMIENFEDTFNKEFLSEFIAMIGFYPVGAKIILANNCEAVVMLNDPEKPELPALVKVITNPAGEVMHSPQLLDLRKHPELLSGKQERTSKILDIFSPIVQRELSGFESVA